MVDVFLNGIQGVTAEMGQTLRLLQLYFQIHIVGVLVYQLEQGLKA